MSGISGNSVPPFIQRLVEEEKALKTKIDAIEIFVESHLHATIGTVHRVLLGAQLDAMKAYHKVLALRLKMHVDDRDRADTAEPASADVTVEEAEAGTILEVRTTGGTHDETPLPFAGDK